MRNVLWISVTRPKEREAWIVSDQQREQQRTLQRGRDDLTRAQYQRTGSQPSAVNHSAPPSRGTTNWQVTTSPAEMRKKQPLPARGKSLQLTHPHVPLPLAYWSDY